MHSFTLIFLAAVVLTTGIQLWLATRQKRAVETHRDVVPEAFRDRISLEAHQKAADYTRAKLQFGGFELLFSTAVLLLWTLGGGLNVLDTLWRGFGWSQITTGVAFMLSVFVIVSLLGLPASLYQTFVIEERFGFNRTNLKTFFVDLLKSGLLLLVIGTPFLWLVLWLMGSMGPSWWLYVWLTYMALSLGMLWLYPSVIAPLFNKFSPLADETLKQRIDQLLKRCGFSNNGIFVMDGSRRSSHGNAYFTGMGKNKRIVFFDTLTDSLDHDEIEAVLAHELGHFKKKHVTKRILIMALASLAGLALLGWLAQTQWFYTALGVEQGSTYMALMLFLLVMPVFSFLLTPVFSAYSRKHEFEADEFAAQNSDADKLTSALVKLYEENAKTLTPDNVYSAFYDSHPPAPIRIQHLAQAKG
ncbi:MAG: M48 family metallopeptidase [Gammaproteobacteria bacterium]|nr:M48 family metallopeptidase [Gammaproteobacteria bacterium]